MNEQRASVRPAARMMRWVPESYPLDMKIALPAIRQAELQPNARLGTEVGLAEHLV